MSSISPNQLESPILARLHAYWLERRQGREFPSRRDIDPLDFPYMLGRIMLLDVLRPPLRFRFRVHGTQLASCVGYEMTGKMLDDVPVNAHRDVLQERCAAVVEGRAATALHGRDLRGERCVGYEALWLPLSGDGRVVNMLLVALDCDGYRGDKSADCSPDPAAA